MSCFLGEGRQVNLVRTDAVKHDQVQRAPQKHARLSRAWAGWQVERTVNVQDRVALIVVGLEANVLPEPIKRDGLGEATNWPISMLTGTLSTYLQRSSRIKNSLAP